MKRAFLLVWVIVASMGQLIAKDQMDLAFRQKECERMSKEFTEHSKVLEARAKQLNGDAAKAANELSALKKEEAKNMTELAEAIDKKQWSSIKRYDKKGQELCHEWETKIQAFEKKFGDRPGDVALAKSEKERLEKEQAEKERVAKEGKTSFHEKSDSVASKPEENASPKPEWKKEPEPEPVAEVKAEEPPSENSNPSLDKINAQAQGLGNP